VVGKTCSHNWGKKIAKRKTLTAYTVLGKGFSIASLLPKVDDSEQD
jgi:hypothetical protein